MKPITKFLVNNRVKKENAIEIPDLENLEPDEYIYLKFQVNERIVEILGITSSNFDFISKDGFCCWEIFAVDEDAPHDEYEVYIGNDDGEGDYMCATDDSIKLLASRLATKEEIKALDAAQLDFGKIVNAGGHVSPNRQAYGTINKKTLEYERK